MTSRWPSTLWLVRHGESAGNVARDAAHAASAERIDIGGRDVDVPLSGNGEAQADALGRWFARGAAEGRPEVLLVSPYLRAQQTAARFRAAGGTIDRDVAICTDERLREKEFGILDGLTTHGVQVHLPEQAAFRAMLGKFYHRPPGGESWCDVILRLRSLINTIALHHAERRVMIVAHQVVVLCMRYIIENLDETQILEIDRAGDVANCSVTEYRLDPAAGAFGNPVLQRYNATTPIDASPAPVTDAPDTISTARG